jgi:heat shock protein HslJ
MKTTLFATFLLGTTLATGCSHEAEEQAISVIGSSWRLEAVQQMGAEMVFIPANEKYTLQFVLKDKVTGQNLCNTYWATCNVQNMHKASFSEYGATKVHCPTPSYELEFADLLLSANSLDATNSHLSLYSRNGSTVLHFVRMQ